MSLYLKSLGELPEDAIAKYGNAHPLVTAIQLNGIGSGRICSFIITPYAYGANFVELIRNLEQISQHKLTIDNETDEDKAKLNIMYDVLYTNLSKSVLYPHFTLEDIIEDMQNDAMFIFQLHSYIETTYSYEQLPVVNMIGEMFPDIDMLTEKENDMKFIQEYRNIMYANPYSLPLKFSILNGRNAFYCIINKLTYTQKKEFHKKLSECHFSIWKKIFRANGEVEQMKQFSFVKENLTDEFVLPTLDIMEKYIRLFHKPMDPDTVDKMELYNFDMLTSYDQEFTSVVEAFIDLCVIYREPYYETKKMTHTMIEILTSAMGSPVKFQVKDIEGEDLVVTNAYDD